MRLGLFAFGNTSFLARSSGRLATDPLVSVRAGWDAIQREQLLLPTLGRLFPPPRRRLFHWRHLTVQSLAYPTPRTVTKYLGGVDVSVVRIPATATQEHRLALTVFPASVTTPGAGSTAARSMDWL